MFSVEDNPVFLKYRFDCDRLHSGICEWKEAKLILLGNGQVGKTTLLRNLTNLLREVSINFNILC